MPPSNPIRAVAFADFERHKKPISNYTPDHSKGWAFSFKYFKQMEFFGLKSESNSWFVSLIERLQDICTKNLEEFNSNHVIKDDYRYHEINWNSRNTPIKRNELNWIDKSILENEEEFPFYQFQISKANGRVVGFWDNSQTIFHIVLLDPKHNIQPSKYYNYKVDKTSVSPCLYTSILFEIDKIKAKKCFCDKCTFKSELTNLQGKFTNGNFVYFQLDDDFYMEFKEKTRDKSITEIVEQWLIE